ncbi:dihydroxyacetone kinase subunit DhaL [Hyalangium versicolor]|uniref:dihydroxyacetone kinase subunit DhaL n=1 Tax=Hyalangium versicolor TaxID=2861190 RepID=UPI001CC90698|nr:dihydroxyacetone kinase subunit DhaL [Hyalangium versicolor]
MPITRDAIAQWIQAYAAAIAEQKDALTQLDMAIGDGDHGENMHRGFQAVRLKLPAVAEQDIGTLLKTVAMTLISTVGGASGPLYGTLFLQMATRTAGKQELTPSELAEALKAGIDGVISRGKAALGDKTMIDALHPAIEAFQQALGQGAELKDALNKAATAAEQGRQATIPLVARKGRASYLGERSAGHPDPGATSSLLLIQCAARTLG